MHTCAAVIPMYQPMLSPAEQLSVEQTLEMLPEYPVYLVGPEKLETYFEQLCNQYGSRIRYVCFKDQFFKSIQGYNTLLLSKCFYLAFAQFEYILIVQTDALVLNNSLEYWCAKQYSYIGAPWFDGYTRPTIPLTLNSVGNGGFSLRRIPDFLRVLSKPRIFKNVLMQSWPGGLISNAYRYLKDYHSFVYCDTQVNIDVNEDIFWGLFVSQQCRFFSVPSPQESVAFAFEAHPDYLYQLNNGELPFGCHAWQRYNPNFWIDVAASKGLSLNKRLSALPAHYENE